MSRNSELRENGIATQLGDFDSGSPKLSAELSYGQIDIYRYNDKPSSPGKTDIARPEDYWNAANAKFILEGVLPRCYVSSDTPSKETPLEKQNREVAEKTLPLALRAIKQWDFPKLYEAVASLNGNDEAMNNLEKLLSTEVGVRVAFNDGGQRVTLSDRFEHTGRNGPRTTTTDITFDSNGRAVLAQQRIEHRDGEVEISQKDVKKAELEFSFKIGRSTPIRRR